MMPLRIYAAHLGEKVKLYVLRNSRKNKLKHKFNYSTYL
jgi:hypothetical protein